MEEYLIKRIEATPNWEEIPTLKIDNVLWDSDDSIKAGAKLCTNGGYLFVHMWATEEDVLAEYTKPLSPVYKDSCLEFFFKIESQDNYFNFEINPNGAMILQYGVSGFDRFHIIREEEKEYFDIRTNRTPDGWELFYRIPRTFISTLYNIEYEFQGTLQANMYKCGGAIRNYLSWSRVNSNKPNFHRPEDFGKMRFEA